MKMAFLFALFTCLLFVELSRAESPDMQSPQHVRREICRLEAASNHIAEPLQKTFFKRCNAELKIAGWLGEFYYDARFYPDGFAGAQGIKARSAEGPAAAAAR